MNNYLLGRYIREKRDSLGMSLREFGRMCDISHTTIDCIEKGYDPRTGKEVNITNNTLGKLSQALCVPIAKLVELSQGVEEAPTPVSESGQHINIVKIAGRDGSYREKRLTDEQVKALQAIIDQMPEAPKDL